jgi:hypothetical protein
LLLTNTLPLTDSAAVGAKFTLNVVLCPAPRVSGVRPLILKAAPETLSEETFTLALPVLVNVTVWLLLLPTVTFPKLNLVGLVESCIVAGTPVPLSAMLVGELGALLMSETMPVTPPATAGAKASVKFDLCPGLRVRGRAKPLVVKPLPETAACEIVRLPVPEFAKVMVCVFLVPTTTLPKLALLGVAARGPEEEEEVIVTVAEADLDVSALLVAVTKAVPGLEGAV